MTASGCAVTFTWGDGEHTFALPIGQLSELQEKTDCGPEELYGRLIVLPPQSGGVIESLRVGSLKPKARDIREIIRLGLIGGGMEPIKAAVLVKRYVDESKLGRQVHYLAAQAILGACIFGVQDDQPGKAKAPAATSQTPSAETNGSSSPASTAPVS